jgi:hypothetical protein
MRTLLLSCVAIAMVCGPALACRGTAEFPEVEAHLVMADLSEADRAAYAEQLQEGIALHEQGHELDSQEVRQQSLEILDDLKVKLGM